MALEIIEEFKFPNFFSEILERVKAETKNIENLKLISTAEGLILKESLNKNNKPLKIDFLSGEIADRIKKYQNEDIIKALGKRIQSLNKDKIKLSKIIGESSNKSISDFQKEIIKSLDEKNLYDNYEKNSDNSHPFRVLDATAGFGRDSIILAASGCEVVSLERNILMYSLLKDGIERLKKVSNNFNIDIKNIDSVEFLKNTKEKFDIIYLDPMFPHTNKSRLVKKEMIILREIVGDDEDFEVLFNLALEKTNNKVILKRPAKAKIIGNLKPNYQIFGRINRFDIYK